MRTTLSGAAFCTWGLLAAALLGGGAFGLQAAETLKLFQVQTQDPEGTPLMRTGASFGTNRISFILPDGASAALDADQKAVYITTPDKSYTVQARFFTEPVVSTNLQQTFKAQAEAARPEDKFYYETGVFTSLGNGFRYDFTHPYPPPGVAMNESVVFVPIPQGYMEISLRTVAPKLLDMHYVWNGLYASFQFEPERK